jgi:cell division protein FtsL
MHCPHCGRDIQASWTYCLHCGNAIPSESRAIELSDTQPMAVPEPRDVPPPPMLVSASEDRAIEYAEAAAPHRSRARVIGVVALAAVVLASATAGFLFLSGELRETREQLAAQTSELNTTKGQLKETAANLADTRSTLAQTMQERDGLKKQVNKLTVDLKGVKGTLQEAQNTVELQTGQIATLKTCLGGVSEAMNDIVYGYYNAAVNALTRVESECNEAYALF